MNKAPLSTSVTPSSLVGLLFSEIIFNNENTAKTKFFLGLNRQLNCGKRQNIKRQKSSRRKSTVFTLSSSLPSLGFSHELISPCRTGPQSCQLACNAVSASYCAPAKNLWLQIRLGVRLINFSPHWAGIIFTSTCGVSVCKSRSN